MEYTSDWKIALLLTGYRRALGDTKGYFRRRYPERGIPFEVTFLIARRPSWTSDSTALERETTKRHSTRIQVDDVLVRLASPMQGTMLPCDKVVVSGAILTTRFGVIQQGLWNQGRQATTDFPSSHPREKRESLLFIPHWLRTER